MPNQKIHSPLYFQKWFLKMNCTDVKLCIEAYMDANSIVEDHIIEAQSKESSFMWAREVWLLHSLENTSSKIEFAVECFD